MPVTREIMPSTALWPEPDVKNWIRRNFRLSATSQ
jgi:hypothetical protein